MMIRTAVVTLALGLAAAGTAGAWGIPTIPGITSASSSSSYGDPDAFLAKAKNAEALIDKSADSLYKAVASKEEQAKMEELQKKLNETTDDKEKNALRQEITESEMATIGKRAKDKQLQKEAKKWDAKKKEMVSTAFYNFSLGALQAGLLVPEGTNLASSLSSGNPITIARFALKVTSIWEAVKTIKGILGGTANVIGAMKPLMSAAHIEVKTPSSATEQPKDASSEL